MNKIEEYFLKPLESTFFWLGIYRRLEDKAKRVGFVGPTPPCHEFEFGKGNVGLSAEKGLRKVIADVSQDEQYSMCFIKTASEMVEPIYYEDKVVGVIDAESDKKEFFTDEIQSKVKDLARTVSPILLGSEDDAILERNLRVYEWLLKAREIKPEAFDWVGIYYKASFLTSEDSTDLLLGPFIGEPTDHVRIPKDRGFCGLAISTEKTVNVPDVTADDRHIACSIKTRSELVVPLKDKDGNIVAELDIDSNKLSTFSEDLEKEVESFCTSFADIL